MIDVSADEKKVPRWVQVSVALVVCSFTLLCGFASIVLLFDANEKNLILAVVVGFFLLLGCLWVLEKCFRLLTGRRSRGGLMTPTALRVVSVFFLILPVVGFFTGYYRKIGLVAIYQAVMYFFGFLGIRALARKREASEAADQRAKQ
jgi:hypothetical protein